MTMRSKQWYINTSRLPNSRVNSSIAPPVDCFHRPRTVSAKRTFAQGFTPVTQPKNPRGFASQQLPQKRLRIAKEVRSIQHRAAEHDARIVSVGPLVLFSTQTGDAWILDPADQLAARLASDGGPLAPHLGA